MGKLINRIPGSRPLISNLPCSASKTYVESLLASLGIQQAFWKPCQVNLTSKDTLLVSADPEADRGSGPPLKITKI